MATIQVQTRLMLHWSQIAVEHERLALARRVSLENARREGGHIDLHVEMHPAMVAIAGAAHAIEALYREIAELVQPESIEAWERARKHGRWSEVQAALELAFVIAPGRWRSELARLFKLRNGLVHPKSEFTETVPHPLGVNTAPEYVDYSAETATWAIDLLLEILATCIESPREPLREWAGNARHSVEALLKLRSRSTA